MEAYLDPELIRRFLGLISKRLSLVANQNFVDVGLGDLFDIFEINDHFEFQVQDLARIVKKLVDISDLGVKFLGYRLEFQFDHDGRLFAIEPDSIGRLWPDASCLVFKIDMALFSRSKTEYLNMNGGSANDLKITKSGYIAKREGDFLFNGDLIALPEKALYRDVLGIIFAHHEADGLISYETIENELRKLGYHALKKDRSRTRVRNSLSDTQGLFRYAKINGSPLDNKLPNGKKLIETVRGRGVRFNNVRG